MDDLDELKGRVERATRVLSEREAEEQGRHSKLVSLVGALESKSLEARREKEEAEARLAAVEAENAELRGLLSGLLSAVEAGSRSRFADALYALEARVSGLSPASPAATPEGAGVDAPAEPEDSEEARARTALSEAARQLAGGDPEGLDEFTAQLAAGCAVEEELALEAEALNAEAADDAKALLARIRQQVEAPDPALDPEIEPEVVPDAEADEAVAVEAELDSTDVDAVEPEVVVSETGDEAAERPAEDEVVEDGAPEDRTAQDTTSEKPAGERMASGESASGVGDDDGADDDGADDDGDWTGKRQAAS